MTRFGILRTAVFALLAISPAGNFFTIGYLAHQWQSGPGARTMALAARHQSTNRAARPILRSVLL